MVPLPTDDAAWSYEVKWDGVRVLAEVTADRLTLRSRNGNDVTAAYPELAGMAAAVGRDAVLDGEVVAFDDRGRSNFGLLQERMHVRNPSAALLAATPVQLLLFDLLRLDGQDAQSLSYDERRELLTSLALQGKSWSVPPAFPVGRDLLEATRAQGLEGVMAKRRDSRYLPGRRSDAWLKVKNIRRASVVVAGWKPGEGERAGRIGSLLLGVQGESGLEFAGHVGTGFTRGDLDPAERAADPAAANRFSFCHRGPTSSRQSRGLGGARSRCRSRLHRVDTRGQVAAPVVQGTSRRPRPPGREARMSEKVTVDVEGQQVVLSNLDKVLYPEVGFTKGQVLDYYSRIAPVLLPHLAGRAVTRKRYPDGVDAMVFFEKNAPRGTPDWVHAETLPSPGSTKNRDTIDYVVVDDLADPGLDRQPGRARAPHPPVAGAPEARQAGDAGTPGSLVFDLDPGRTGDDRRVLRSGRFSCARRWPRTGTTRSPRPVAARDCSSTPALTDFADSEETSAYAKSLAQRLESIAPRAGRAAGWPRTCDRARC